MSRWVWKRHGNPFQYTHLENFMDRGICSSWDAVHGVTKSWTWWRKKQLPTPVFWPGESPWTEEPGGLQSTGFQRVRLDWTTFPWFEQLTLPLLLGGLNEWLFNILVWVIYMNSNYALGLPLATCLWLYFSWAMLLHALLTLKYLTLPFNVNYLRILQLTQLKVKFQVTVECCFPTFTQL